jgi:hypothetical protein
MDDCLFFNPSVPFSRSEKLPIDGKDLVAYLVTAIVSAGAITNGLAVLVITIAIKRGLDRMCKAKPR